MKPDKIIQFPTQVAFHEFLDELRKAYDEDRLKDFVCIYSHDYKKGKEKEGFLHGLNHYWFSQENSTVYSLGLVEVMKDEILHYMAEKCEED